MTDTRSRQLLPPVQEMPAGIYAGVLLSALFELAWLGITLSTLSDTPEQAAGRHLAIGQLSFPLNGLVAWTLLAGMVTITIGCRAARPWARYAVLACWMLPAAASPWPTTADALARMAYGIGIAACMAAYLFRNGRVEAYFSAGRDRSMGSTNPHAPRT